MAGMCNVDRIVDVGIFIYKVGADAPYLVFPSESPTTHMSLLQFVIQP